MRVSYRVEETAAGTIISVFDDIDLANATMRADALFTLVDAGGGGPERQLVERVGFDRLMSIVADIPPAHEQAKPSAPAAAR